MTIHLKLAGSQKQDLQVLSEVDPGLLSSVIEQLRGLKEPIIRPSDLREVVAASIEPETARILVRQLFALATIRRDRNLTAKEVVGALSEAIEAGGPSDEKLTKWRGVSVQLEELLSLDAISRVAKTIDLSFDYTNLLRKARILTDIRPVYDEAHSHIAAAIVSQTLRLEYQSEDGAHSLSVTVDENDVELLQESCKIALKKAREAKRLMTESCNIKAVILGDDLYDT